jgi:hypothetical protein
MNKGATHHTGHRLSRGDQTPSTVSRWTGVSPSLHACSDGHKKHAEHEYTLQAKDTDLSNVAIRVLGVPKLIPGTP